MKIDNTLINRLAELSKLEFDDAAKVKIENDLQNILNLVEKLNEVDVTGIDPLIYLTDEKNILREDIVQGEVSKEEALSNAPLADSDYFKVPKVISK